MESRRAYHQEARAAEVEVRRARILDAAAALFREHHYDDVTLERIAARADVSLKTVTRQFGSKEELLLAGIQYLRGREERARATVPGDVAAVPRVLGARYEEMGDFTMRFIAVEERSPVAAAALDAGRNSHRAWLEQVFARWLPPRGAERARRLAALFGATEIYVWTTWRRHLGMSVAACEAAMLETLQALIKQWEGKR